MPERRRGYRRPAHYPCRHRPLILDDRGLQGIQERATELTRQRHEQGLIDQVTIRAIGQPASAARDRLHTILDADGRGQAAEQHAAGRDGPPRAAHHRVEARVVFGEMQHGTADHDVGEAGRERHALDRLGAEVVGRQLRRQRRGQPADRVHRSRVGIAAVDVEALAEEIHEIAAAAAAGVKDAHATLDAPAQQLIEQIDVNVAELLVKGHSGCAWMNSAASGWRRLTASESARSRSISKSSNSKPGPTVHPTSV